MGKMGCDKWRKTWSVTNGRKNGCESCLPRTGARVGSHSGEGLRVAERHQERLLHLRTHAIRAR